VFRKENTTSQKMNPLVLVTTCGLYFGYPLEVSTVITKVQKWGNSQGLRLSKELLAGVDIEVGDAVDVSVLDGALIVTPVRRVRGGHNLAELVREIPADYQPSALDWGPPTGREVW
jgi:antitoxin MazE